MADKVVESSHAMIGELTKFAAEQQRRFDTATSVQERKERGHFGTPPIIAQFMAGMFSEIPPQNVKILDAGAGVGTLSAAICQRMLTQKSPRLLRFEIYETDPKLIPLLEQTMNYCKLRLREAGHEMTFVIRVEDFILANTTHSLFETTPEASFHLAILNPPYFKLRKESMHARVMEHIVHGQPNIYALFMAVAAELLLPGGEMVAITPRSYCNGPYFKRFRKWLFDRLTLRQIHVFESRTEAFKEDAVLQENIILHAVKNGMPGDVVLTTSLGRDLKDVARSKMAHDKIIDNNNGDHVIRVSTNRFEQDIMEAMETLPQRFRSFGLEISTGPVVAFRATEFLRHNRDKDTAPLLWMHNVRPFLTRFPAKNGKPPHIVIGEASKKLLIPAKTYLLLKRFTAKEEKRRIVAGIMNPNDSYSEWVGLENHLNYIYRKGSELARAEAFGLGAFLNSAFVDRYFRAISGNTQVNATEIRGLPMPDEGTLMKIGEEIQNAKTRDHNTIERIVGQSLGLPQSLMKQLIGSNS